MAWLIALGLLVALVAAANYKKVRFAIAPVEHTSTVKKEILAVLGIACFIAFVCAIGTSEPTGKKKQSTTGASSHPSAASPTKTIKWEEFFKDQDGK